MYYVSAIISVSLAATTKGKVTYVLKFNPAACIAEEAPCCTHPNMPWFLNTLSEITTEDIQLKLCSDNTPSNEGPLLKLIEHWITLCGQESLWQFAILDYTAIGV